jgi:protein ImuB
LAEQSVASTRRVLAVVLPGLACELARQREPIDEPLAVIFDGRVEDESAARLDAVDDEARRHGVRAGQRVVEATALVSQLAIRHVTSDALRGALGRVAELALSFGTTAAVELDDTVWLDITGAAHLVGSEHELARTLSARVAALGHRARVAISDGPLLAQAFARFQAGPQDVVVVPAGEAKRALASLPLAALPLDGETSSLFSRLGVTTVEELARLPRSGLHARLSSKRAGAPRSGPWGGPGEVTTATVLELLEGRDVRPLVPYELPRVLEEEVSFEEGIEQVEALLFVLRGMASRMASRLAARGEAVTRLTLTIDYDRSIFALRSSPPDEGGEGSSTPREELCVELPAPLSREADLLRTLRAKLEQCELRAPAVSLTLSLPRLTRAHRVQLDLSRDVSVSPDALPSLLAELSAEVGSHRVGVLERVDAHRPELRSRLVPVGPPSLPSGRGMTGPTSSWGQDPSRLLPVPVPVSAGGRLGPGARLVLGGSTWTVEEVHMSQRLDGVEWWTEHPVSRDYASVWLSHSHPAPHDSGPSTPLCARAWVYCDRRTGSLFLHGWWE